MHYVFIRSLCMLMARGLLIKLLNVYLENERRHRITTLRIFWKQSTALFSNRNAGIMTEYERCMQHFQSCEI